MDVRSHSLYLIHREIREQGICKNKYNVYYRYICVFTRSTQHAARCTILWFDVCREVEHHLFILYIIIFYIIIYNIKYLLIIYNFQEAVFITFEKSKWDSVAAWLRVVPLKIFRLIYFYIFTVRQKVVTGALSHGFTACFLLFSFAISM